MLSQLDNGVKQFHFYLFHIGQVEQLEHEFAFGTAVAADLLVNDAAYRRWYLDNFEVHNMKSALGKGFVQYCLKTAIVTYCFIKIVNPLKLH